MQKTNNKIMRILIVTPYYLPDSGPSAPLFALLSESLVRRGHFVTVISAVPHYPSGKVQAEFRKMPIKKTVEQGVRVIRLPVPSMNRTRFSLRLIQFCIYQVQAAWVGLQEHYDVCLFSNPFFMVGIPYFILASLRRKPVIYSIHDVYPDVGIKLGIFRHKWVIAIVAILEKFFLDRAKFVRILSESFVEPMIALGVPDKKLALIYDWVDTSLIQPGPRDNSFAHEYNLIGKQVILYAGNIGLSQGLENVLSVAEILKDDPEFRFVFVGDGVGRVQLEKAAIKRGLVNVQFIPFQDRSRLSEVLAIADLSLVILLKGVGKGSLPSKSFSIMASSRPILASVDADSDIAKLIIRSQGGVCVPPEDPEALANAILRLKTDQKEKDNMGVNGQIYVEKFHSPNVAAVKFEELFIKAIQNENI